MDMKILATEIERLRDKFVFAEDEPVNESLMSQGYWLASLASLQQAIAQARIGACLQEEGK
jgi:hypothetical protein